MAVVPVVLALLGHKAWWLPKWLDRILPDVDVDVEGERLHKVLAGRTADPNQDHGLVNI